MRVKVRETKEWEKCPECNWPVLHLYGFTSNPGNEMLCGECFAQMLTEEKYEIKKAEEA